MNITSIVFSVFCAGTILIYWRLPFRFRSWWLLGVSTLFVVSWSWELACILLVVASTNFTLGQWLQSEKTRRRVLLWTGILFDIFVLLALKYSDFYLQALVRLSTRIGIEVNAGGLQLLAPVGLSFITLQMISYLVDISRSQLTAEKRWLEFSLYVLYFPKFLSGPIERAKTFIPKLGECCGEGLRLHDRPLLGRRPEKGKNPILAQKSVQLGSGQPIDDIHIRGLPVPGELPIRNIVQKALHKVRRRQVLGDRAMVNHVSPYVLEHPD